MSKTNEKTERRRFSAVAADAFRRWLSPRADSVNAEFLRKKTLVGLGKEVLYGVFALLLSRGTALGGTHPFGIAFLAAGRHDVAALTGLLVSAILPGGSLIEAAASLLIFGCRLAAGWLVNGRRTARRREPLPIRMAIGAAGGFTVGMVGIVAAGFTLPALGAAIFEILAVPAAVFLFSGLSARGTGKAVLLYRQAGRLLLLYAFVLSLNGIAFFGLSPALMAALFSRWRRPAAPARRWAAFAALLRDWPAD